MNEVLDNLAQLIGLNIYEAYLDLEKNDSAYTLWVIERGTGGCTFPSMEVLAENIAIDKNLTLSLLVKEEFIKEVINSKEKIKNENPHFYDTVFK